MRLAAGGMRIFNCFVFWLAPVFAQHTVRIRTIPIDLHDALVQQIGAVVTVEEIREFLVTGGLARQPNPAGFLLHSCLFHNLRYRCSSRELTHFNHSEGSMPLPSMIASSADPQKAVVAKNPDHLVRREPRRTAFTQP
jgi:hypothetical protein